MGGRSARGAGDLSRRAAPSWVAALAVAAVACGAGASAFRGYELVVEARDTLSAELAAALRARGARVRRTVRGGGGPSAAVIHFQFRPPPPDSALRLYVRVVDTRSGVVLAGAGVVLDSLAPHAGARAQAAVDSLLIGRPGAGHPPP